MSVSERYFSRHGSPSGKRKYSSDCIPDDLGREPIPGVRARADVLIPPDYSPWSGGASASSEVDGTASLPEQQIREVVNTAISISGGVIFLFILQPSVDGRAERRMVNQ